MLGFGYDRNGSYISPKASSITLSSVMTAEGYSESESEDDCSYLTDLAKKIHGDKRSFASETSVAHAVVGSNDHRR